MAKEVILTKEGYEKLKQEIDYLSTEKRREVAERIRVTREFGDIAENSEYDDAKMEQGRVEGRTEGHARLLRKLLTVRFGALPASARARIADADEATLSRWGVRLLTAETLDDVFGEARRAPRASKARGRVRRSPA